MTTEQGLRTKRPAVKHPDDRRLDWLDEHVERWIDAGLLSPEQADRIVRLETGTTPARVVTRRLPIAAETLAYGGSALALMGGSFVVARTWSSIPFVARLLVGLVLAAVGLLGGRALRTMHEAGADRLAGFLWTVGAGGVALATGVAVDAAGVDSPPLVTMGVGAAVLVVGVALWRNLERPLQLLTAVAGAVITASALAAHLALPVWIGGAVLWAAALAVGWLAASGRLHPDLLALLLAAVGLLIGAGMQVEWSDDVGTFFGLATAAGIVVAALALRLPPLVAVGVIGMLVFLQMLFSLYFTGAFASAAVTLVGVVVVVLVLVRTLRGRADDRAG